MSAYDVITKALEPFIKDHSVLVKACNAVSTELDNGGWLTTDNDHLAMMRSALQQIAGRVNNPDIADRDLAALTNRLAQFSAEVTSMEEKQRQEGRIKRGSTDRPARGKGFDPSSI